MNNPRTFNIRFLTWVFVMLVGTVPAFAQTTGRLEGTVQDSAGAAIPGAHVSIKSASLIAEQQGETDEDGRYRFFNLPPGLYTVSVKADNFQTNEQKDVSVNLDRTSVVSVTLAPAGVSETLTVVSGEAAVDPTRTETSTVVDQNLFSRLPTSRTLQSIISIAPSVIGSGIRDANGRDAAQSVGGSSGPENNYIIDGLSTGDPAFGLQGANIAFEFIQEVEVKTFGFSAEYGQSTGGIINAITKSGGDQFHGDAFAYFTPSGLVADVKPSAFPVSGNIPNGFSEYDLGADLGGPLVKRKLWFFVAVNPQFRTNHYLGQSFHVPFENDVTTPFYAGKLSWQPHQNHRFIASTFSDVTTLEGGNPFSSGFSTDLRYLQVRRRTGGPNYTFRYEGVLSNRLVTQARLGLHYQRDNIENLDPARDLKPFVRDRTAIDPVTGRFARDLVLPGSGFGGNPFSAETPTSQGANRREFGYDLSYFLPQGRTGEHALKAGYQYQNNHYRVHTRRSGGGRIDNFYINLNPADINHPVLQFVASRFEDYRQDSDSRTRLHGFYVQDTWRPFRHLALNLGVRWDLFKVEPNESSKPLLRELFGRDYIFKFTKLWENTAPRLGFSYDFTHNGRGKFYGSFARFFGVTKMDLNARAGASETLNRTTFDGPNATGNVIGRQVFGAFPALIDPDLKNSYLDEATTGLEYEVVRNVVVGGRFVWRNLGRTIEDGSFDGGNNFFIMNPGESLTGRTAYRGPIDLFLSPDLESLTHIDNAVVPFPKATRRYRAVELTAAKRYANNYQFVTSYVWSRLTGNYEGLFFQNTGQLDPNLTALFDLPELLFNADGRLNNDRPHQFKLDGSYDWNFGLELGLSLRALSGTPISQLGPSPAYGNSLAFLSPRGTVNGRVVRTPNVATADLHVAYRRSFGERYGSSLILDIFNLLNRQEALEVDQDYRLDIGDLRRAPLNPLFGGGRVFQYPRTVRFGLKFHF